MRCQVQLAHARNLFHIATGGRTRWVLQGGWGKLAQTHGTTLEGAGVPITTAQMPPGRCRSKQASPRLSPRCRWICCTTCPSPPSLMPAICPLRCPKLFPQWANPRWNVWPPMQIHPSPLNRALHDGEGGSSSLNWCQKHSSHTTTRHCRLHAEVAVDVGAQSHSQCNTCGNTKSTDTNCHQSALPRTCYSTPHKGKTL